MSNPVESGDGCGQNPYATHTPNPTKESAGDLPNTRGWDKTGVLPCGYRVGKLGGLWYVLDREGWAVSEGYHEISDDGETGKIGAEIKELDLRGQPGTEDADTGDAE